MKRMTMFALVPILLVASAFGQVSAGAIPARINTVEKMEKWLAEEFEYSMEFPDAWQKAEEMTRTKEGDCEDFAVLVNQALMGQGIKSDIVIIKFEGLAVSHAICAWKEENGMYNFSSNAEVHHTDKTNLIDVIEKYYPDYESIYYLEP